MIYNCMKLKNVILFSALLFSSVSGLSAQRRSIAEEDQKILANKASEIFKVVDPLVKEVSDSVVLFKAGKKIISVGTVTSKGIVTKFSEIASHAAQDELHMVTKDGTVYKQIELLGVYEEYDIAVLKNIGGLPAVDLTKSVSPEVGSFLVSSTASNEALSMGVVSVKPRSLKEKDRGFLGVVMDVNPSKSGGVKLTHVEPQTAADRAGLKKGDIIQTINGDAVKNMLEMRNFLQQLAPGDDIKINFKRGDVVTAGLNVVLGARKEIPRVRLSRMNTMKKMGGKVNDVSEGFPQVLQTDMQIKSNFCGAPVVNLDGELVGVVIAKASRIKAYILEGRLLQELLNTEFDR